MKARRLFRDRRHARLLVQARAGDERAFRRLYRELYDPLSRYVGYRVERREEAEDLVSQVFHRFVENLANFDASRGSVRSWIIQMARNAVIDHWRTRRQSEAIEEMSELLADARANPLESLLAAEEERFEGGILADYPPEIREIFALRFGQGLRYGEIARCMGLSESAVKQRFSRTLRELRRRLRGRESKRGEVDYAI